MTGSMSGKRALTLSLLALSWLASTACVSIPGPPDPNDPWEPWNRSMYDFNDGLDRDIVAPLADWYLELPEGGRTAIHNFFVNLRYPVTIINQFLQGKFERGVEDSARFVFNTTLGLLGFIDIAGPVGFKRHDEDFGQTFAVWGMPQGNFVTWPFLGPSTVRDTIGIPFDFLALPLNWIETPAEFMGLVVVDVVDTRARLAPAIRLRDETAFDPYIFTREAFLQQRLNLIYDGNPPVRDLENLEMLDEKSIEQELLEGDKSSDTTQ